MSGDTLPPWGGGIAQDARKRPSTPSDENAAHCPSGADEAHGGANPCLSCPRNRECLPDGGIFTPLERRIGLAIIRWECKHKGQPISLKRLHDEVGSSVGWCYRAAQSFLRKRTINIMTGRKGFVA